MAYRIIANSTRAAINAIAIQPGLSRRVAFGGGIHVTSEYEKGGSQPPGENSRRCGNFKLAFRNIQLASFLPGVNRPSSGQVPQSPPPPAQLSSRQNAMCSLELHFRAPALLSLQAVELSKPPRSRMFGQSQSQEITGRVASVAWILRLPS